MQEGIVIDTREQMPLKFTRIETKNEKLDFGDYAYEIDGELLPVVIERKSAMDLFQTVTRGHDRFKREIARARLSGCDFYVIVERSYKDILTKNFPNSFRTKLRGNVIISICHTLEAKYGIRFVFCDTRALARKYILNTFNAYKKLITEE